MHLVYLLREPANVCAYAGMHLRHPRCTSRSKSSLIWEERTGHHRDWLSSTFKGYWNTTAHEFPVRGQLELPTSPFIADREGIAEIVAGKHNCSLELQFSAEVTVRPPQAAYTVHVDGLSTLLAP
jgi:hypothetical protein